MRSDLDGGRLLGFLDVDDTVGCPGAVVCPSITVFSMHSKRR